MSTAPVRQVVKTRLQQRHAAGSVSTSAQVCAIRVLYRVVLTNEHSIAPITTLTLPIPVQSLCVGVLAFVSAQYSGVVDCFRRMHAEEGLVGFFKGCIPNALRVSPPWTQRQQQQHGAAGPTLRLHVCRHGCNICYAANNATGRLAASRCLPCHMLCKRHSALDSAAF